MTRGLCVSSGLSLFRCQSGSCDLLGNRRRSGFVAVKAAPVKADDDDEVNAEVSREGTVVKRHNPTMNNPAMRAEYLGITIERVVAGFWLGGSGEYRGMVMLWLLVRRESMKRRYPHCQKVPRFKGPDLHNVAQHVCPGSSKIWRLDRKKSAAKVQPRNGDFGILSTPISLLQSSKSE